MFLLLPQTTQTSCKQIHSSIFCSFTRNTTLHHANNTLLLLRRSHQHCVVHHARNKASCSPISFKTKPPTLPFHSKLPFYYLPVTIKPILHLDISIQTHFRSFDIVAAILQNGKILAQTQPHAPCRGAPPDSTLNFFRPNLAYR